MGSVLATNSWRTVEEEQTWSHEVRAVGVDVDEIFKVSASGAKFETVDDSDNAVGVPSKEASKWFVGTLTEVGVDVGEFGKVGTTTVLKVGTALTSVSGHSVSEWLVGTLAGVVSSSLDLELDTCKGGCWALSAAEKTRSINGNSASEVGTCIGRY